MSYKQIALSPLRQLPVLYSRFSLVIYCIHSSVGKKEKDPRFLHGATIGYRSCCYSESLVPSYHPGGAFDLLDDSQEQECTPRCQLTQSSIVKICHPLSHKAVSPEQMG